ncbi:reverse transcriptase N-terminal domain-containing protein [Hydrocoleum sp. CS-953]|nr:reverse transcriptase N-terminal domain-containing protein [Hydrocoleum sp. CS-953]
MLKSHAARMLAVRQVSQLNSGKKTCGVEKQIRKIYICIQSCK